MTTTTRKILLITYTFPPDNTPAAIRPAQLLRYLPEHGFQPIIIASRSDVAPHSEPDVRRAPEDPIPMLLTKSSAFLRWFMRLAAPYNDRWPWVPFAISAAAELISSEGIEAVYSTSPFLASHFAAFWLKKRYGLPWVADFQDPIRDNPFRTRRWLYPYDLIIERTIFRNADWILANTDAIAARWRKRYPRWADKISVSWNSFDPDEQIGPAEFSDRSYRVLTHAGSLYGKRHPGKLIGSIERLSIGSSALRVHLIGPVDPHIVSAHRWQFDRLMQKGVLELDNCLVPRTDALRATAEADYLLLLDVNEHNTSFQVPSKLLDYIRVGRPILAYTAKNSPVERILSRSAIPYVAIDPEAPDDVSDRGLLQLMQLSPGNYKASDWFTENFSAKTLASSTASILNRLLSTEVCTAASETTRGDRQAHNSLRPDAAAQSVVSSVVGNGADRRSRPVVITTSDAEEEFNWSDPFSHESNNVTAMQEQHVLHQVFDRYKIVPIYLVTYPVAISERGSEFLLACLKEGRCHIGAQLHPWVTPPFDEVVNPFNSFAGNLSAALEFSKIKLLTEAISERFGIRPTTYRAGRYGIGPNTSTALKALGYKIDSSVVPEHSYSHEGGPKFFGHSNMPYWLDPERQLLELPLTSAYIGRFAKQVHRMPNLGMELFGNPGQHALTRGLLARSGLLERIRLTPEGMGLEDAKRLVRELIKQGTTVFTLSYHAPSLLPGSTPYVRSQSDRDRFVQWFDEFYQFFFGELGGVSATTEDVYKVALSGSLYRPEARVKGDSLTDLRPRKP